MHIEVPSPGANGQLPMQSPGAPLSPYGSPLAKGLNGNYVELNDLKGEEAAGSARDVDGHDNHRDSLPPRPEKPADESGWWVVEIISCVVSALALAAILVTVGLMDGQALSNWPMKITLNSFVSFMSTVSKATLLLPVSEAISQLKWLWFRSAGSLEDIQKFDEASRGTWGSLKLLFHTQRVHLAKLGALVMILALCMDPFFQQVIAYPSRRVTLLGSNATIPLVNEYSMYSPGAIMALRQPTVDMKAAIITGLYNTHPRPQDDYEVTPQCRTGNCTWPERYRSLAVCTKCANTTSLITTDKNSCPNGKCAETLPNGLSWDTQLGGQLFMNATGYAKSINFNNTQPTLVAVSTMRGMHGYSVRDLWGIISNECVLYFCVNEYSAEVTNGVFKETVMKSYTQDHDVQDTNNVTITVPPLGNQTAPTDYVVTNTAFRALRDYISPLFNGNVTGYTAETMATSDFMRALYDLGNEGLGVQKPGGENNTIAAIGASLTKTMRLHVGDDMAANDTNNMVLGVTWYEETYVSVQWLWIILPVLLEVMAFTFLIMTIVQCNMSGVAIWKSSTLPILQGKVKDLQESYEPRRR